MDSMDEQYNVLLKAFLPDGLFNYFVMLMSNTDAKIINIYLDELNLSPGKHKNLKLISKGFYPSITIQNFPIRKKAVFLHLRRRKWQIESSGKVVSSNWNMVAKGTSCTKDFTFF